jgi:molybdopterin/thiamine biosynthesis adenylyltransferase
MGERHGDSFEDRRISFLYQQSMNGLVTTVWSSIPDALREALPAVAAHFGAVGYEPVPIPNVPQSEGARIRFPPDACIYVSATQQFPDLPPSVLMDWTGEGRALDWLPLRWPTEGPGSARLIASLTEYVAVSEHYRVAWGCDPTRPFTEDEGAATHAGFRKLLTGAPLVQTQRESAAARVGAPLVEAFSASSVLIVGLGSVGSYMAEQLVRTGVGRLALVDFDLVESHNLSRTAYDLADVGESKATALARHLLRISPSVSVLARDEKLERLPKAQLRELFAEVDLVVAATDDPVTQSIINACAFFSEVPAVYVGLYRGAKGGEVALALPGLTPCFRCLTGGNRALSSAERPERDYGTGRLAGEVALGCDIQHVASVALRVCLGTLAACHQVDGNLRDFLVGAVRARHSFVTLGMEPHYWFYDQLFSGVVGQYAFQSIWLSAESAPDCRVCGSLRQDDPFEAIVPTIDRRALREQLRRG